MFHRLWSGLPADFQFPSDLEGLGLFINKDDEIRQIKDETRHVNFWPSKNKRFNQRQRFALAEACETLVHARLEELGLNKVLLPLGTNDVNKPHVPIFVSDDIQSKSRVVVSVGESSQDLGVLAHRVLGGPGGVNQGSMVSIVKEIQKQTCSPTDQSPPGVIMANTGQLHYWPEGKRAVTMIGWDGAPRQSAVHTGLLIGRDNYIPENKNMKEHIKYIFEKVVPCFTSPTAQLDVIGVCDGAEAVGEYLDWGVTFNRLQSSINCLAIIGGYHAVSAMQCEGYKKFLRERARAWHISSEPLGIILSGPDGNAQTTAFTANGCPIFSGGEQAHNECLLIRCHSDVLGWIQHVALTKDFCNPQIESVTFADPKDDMDEPDWSKWVEAEKAGTPLEPDFGAPDHRLDLSKDGSDESDDE